MGETNRVLARGDERSEVCLSMEPALAGRPTSRRETLAEPIRRGLSGRPMRARGSASSRPPPGSDSYQGQSGGSRKGPVVTPGSGTPGSLSRWGLPKQVQASRYANRLVTGEVPLSCSAAPRPRSIRRTTPRINAASRDTQCSRPPEHFAAPSPGSWRAAPWLASLRCS